MDGAGVRNMEQAMEPLLAYENCRVKVSSVLNKDSRQFGKKFMFDDRDDTCWNSDQGLPQSVQLELPQAAVVKEILVRFQGGFAGKECSLLGNSDSGGVMAHIHTFYADDNSSLQCFQVSHCQPHSTYKLVFQSSGDLYGRITVYSLQFMGRWENS